MVLRQLGQKAPRDGMDARHALNCQAICAETALESEPGQLRWPICQGKTRGGNVSRLTVEAQKHSNGMRECQVKL